MALILEILKEHHSVFQNTWLRGSCWKWNTMDE